MSARANSKSSLFLMEMMVVILFFALTSAICVHLFVQSYQTAQQSEALTNGVIQAESAAEIYKNTNGNLKQCADILEPLWQTETELALSYDAAWQPTVSDDDAHYFLYMTEQSSQPVKTAEILLCMADGSEIYRLTVRAYQVGGDANE